jgi:FkbM family methyltransferase
MSLLSAVHTLTVQRRLPYRLDRAWQRMAQRLGMRERTVTRDGLRFRVRRLTCDEDFVVNVVERSEYLQHGLAITAGDRVLDIGGNIGTFAVFAASHGARVVTIEPDAENLALLRHNLALNDMAASVTVIEAALTPHGNVTVLHKASEGGYHTTNASRYAGARDFSQQRSVIGIRLETALSRLGGRCALLKIDCEGAEFEAIAACPLVALRQIDQIAMEYHTSDRDTVRAMVDRLAQAGLEVRHEDRFDSGRGGHLYLITSGKEHQPR